MLFPGRDATPPAGSSVQAEPRGILSEKRASRRGGHQLAALAMCLGLSLNPANPTGAAQTSGPARFVVSGPADNDVCRMLRKGGMAVTRFDLAVDALREAREREGVLLLADGSGERAALLSAELFALAARKELRLYVECPGYLPGLEVESPRQAVWERAVVTSDFFGPALSSLSILSPPNGWLVPIRGAKRPFHLGLARVAGYDRAVYGLPDRVDPLLFELPPGEGRGAVLVAASRLSQPLTGRLGPVPSWQAVWSAILAWVNPGVPIELRWEPTVRPLLARDDPVPAHLEEHVLRRGVDWFLQSRLLLAPTRTNEVARCAAAGTAPAPAANAPVGDGSLGILEGYFSRIQPDGSQLQSVARRGDCHAESAMALAFGARIFGEERYAATARKLLDFYYFKSGARGGARSDPNHGAFGLVAWGVGTPAWLVANYGDDNARLLLGTLAASSLLGEDRWDEAMLQCLLANLRTTGSLGFRGGRIDIPELSRQGWEHFFNRPIIHYAPHYESYLWACYVWAYRQTGYALFLQRAQSAIGQTMAAYPDQWRWTNGLQQERARMLLCLAWLTRLHDTPEHRGWLRRVAEDLLILQDTSGAIREEMGALDRGQMRPPDSNEAYGTGETPLLQENGDPVCDLLYTCNFAFLGLHEAAAATGDSFYAQAEDRLARFLCRIQVCSDRHPELDGAWFRAFDYRLWDYWASNADAGWGAWSIESGWTQGWITAVLALRHLKTSLWDLTGDSGMPRLMARWRPRMIPDGALSSESSTAPPQGATP